MHIQYFPNQSNRRIYPLGVHENTTYFYVDSPEMYRFFAIDFRFPNNWISIGEFSKEDIQYGYPTLSPDCRFLNILFLKMNHDEYVFGVKRTDLSNRKEDEFRFSGDLMSMLRVNFEHIQIRAGSNGELVLFDRTVVRGSLPFWNIRLNEETKQMILFHNPIGPGQNPVDQNGCLFTIAVDPVNGVFAKLMDPRKMLVYTQSSDEWVPYTIPTEHTLIDVFGTDGFPVEENRSVHETYGRHGHRVGAMQTRLTFHDSNGTTVARLLHQDKRNTTAVVEFDHTHRHIHVRKLATFHLHDVVSRMFYLIATPDIHVFMGVHDSAVVYIRSPSLEEIAGLKMMEILNKDGFSDEVDRISSFQQLLKMAYEKYLLTEDLQELTV